MTCEEIIAECRMRFDDEAQPYKVSDAEFIKYINNAENRLCERCFLIEEAGIHTGNISITFAGTTKKITRSTGSFLTDGFVEGDIIHTTHAVNDGPFTIVSVSALEIVVSETVTTATASTVDVATYMSTIFLEDGIPVYPLDTRVLRINEAVLSGYTDALLIVRGNALSYMNANYSGWRTASEGSPTVLITNGVGTRKVRPYPTPDTAYVLMMTIFRRPRATLAITDMSKEPEIQSEYHRFLMNWILYECYMKGDTETYDKGRAESYLMLHNNDINEIQRMQINEEYSELTIAPPFGGT